jgi:hypothetical protein
MDETDYLKMLAEIEFRREELRRMMCRVNAATMVATLSAGAALVFLLAVLLFL